MFDGQTTTADLPTLTSSSAGFLRPSGITLGIESLAVLDGG